MDIKGKRIYETLKKMNYIRLSTTEGEKDGAKVITDEIKSIGLEPSFEEFKVPCYEIVNVKLEITAPKYMLIEAKGYGYSGNGAKDGIEADFAYIESAEDIDLIGVEGKIVMVSSLGYEVYERLAKAKVAGFIAPSGDYFDNPKNTDLDERMLRKGHIDYGQIPGVCIRMKDAVKILKTEPEKARITLEQKEEEGDSGNILAQIKGTKYPEEVIVYTAHYDSVVFSKGMYDNASGSAMLLELLRYFKQNPPLRTVRFIWCGSEERGLFGSKNYVKSHEEELKDIKLCINVDLAGPVIGRDTAIVIAEDKLCHMIEYMYKEIGHPMSLRHDIYSSDCIPFADKGIPAVNFVRYGAPGAISCHSRNDVLEPISAKSLESTTRFIAQFSNRIVNAYMFPVERTIPEELVGKIDKYLRKKQLKAD
ncbi:MAG: M28 family metallopeptidase [Clostridia bacterium]|nr:M28 family metallopeptidase [Clostridia bacterium]NLV34118.1 Zn-dependent exopeptidase M28 [Clostridiaceae bacterium]HPB17612.1 M28 family metallopeptidase [Clostridia bacterium]HQM95945.1 M28 family metallopeptidase [Clostridia bacterium]HQO69129.1 M28 family metallopeptidase [Clostridia bacterium]